VSFFLHSHLIHSRGGQDNLDAAIFWQWLLLHSICSERRTSTKKLSRS